MHSNAQIGKTDLSKLYKILDNMPADEVKRFLLDLITLQTTGSTPEESSPLYPVFFLLFPSIFANKKGKRSVPGTNIEYTKTEE